MRVIAQRSVTPRSPAHHSAGSLRAGQQGHLQRADPLDLAHLVEEIAATQREPLWPSGLSLLLTRRPIYADGEAHKLPPVLLRPAAQAGSPPLRRPTAHLGQCRTDAGGRSRSCRDSGYRPRHRRGRSPRPLRRSFRGHAARGTEGAVSASRSRIASADARHRTPRAANAPHERRSPCDFRHAVAALMPAVPRETRVP